MHPSLYIFSGLPFLLAHSFANLSASSLLIGHCFCTGWLGTHSYPVKQSSALRISFKYPFSQKGLCIEDKSGHVFSKSSSFTPYLSKQFCIYSLSSHVVCVSIFLQFSWFCLP